ncbi:ribonuclease [Erythrobacter sp. SCSIO 43205]|uniref:ribonuclease n=1 Tax=Erythrobacter sp. SCSIO 43205 TaxID=2779361 RepID=UPI001CA7BB4A|nr:ribonuclease [Erythrobacter sp. SCSIO 43205]UAB79463.1 ribonuclease [Erythrobacter sp. SCSIO 43205]
MVTWLIEHGIGETRKLLIEGGEVVAASLQWPGELTAGEIHTARLTRKAGGARRGTVTLENGREALVDHLPREATEGLRGQVRITRASIAERGRLKLPQARWISGGADDAAPHEGIATHRFEAGAWEEVWHAASTGSIAFVGGEILCAVTPGMTVIDVDGALSPRELALAAVPAIAKALRWFDLGGNIGIDFPSLEAKADRRAVDDAMAEALSDWPHERTAMNGFGFVQIIARLEGPSLLHRFATSRVGMCARYALRVAERVEGNGPVLLLIVHPALKAKLKPEWLEELGVRTGLEVRIEVNPALALEVPQAQIISDA